MKTNLDTLRSEIQRFLEPRGLAVFYSTAPADEEVPAVYWDSIQGDYRAFLGAALAAGARLVSMYVNEFSTEILDEAQERLEDSTLSRDERRPIEQRLREMRAYTGFVCQIELSFDVNPRVYICDLRTGWYEELSELLYQIDDGYEEDDSDDADPLGGSYFSKN